MENPYEFSSTVQGRGIHATLEGGDVTFSADGRSVERGKMSSGRRI